MPEPVSVVVTCFNLEQFIGEAVRSVLEQDYAGEVQTIVVDDCSTDRSRKILAETPGIETVFRERNGGVLQAMISGLRAARHDMVFFLDGDDIWHPEKLSYCMAQLTPETKLCTHDLWYMDSAGSELPRQSRISEALSPAAPAKRSATIEKDLLEHGDHVWLGSAYGVSRSRGAVDAFVAFCEGKDYLDTCYQDWPLAVWVALEQGGDMAYADRKLFGYRVHAENYSGASQTLSKARRNLRKSRDTFRLIEEITTVKRAPADVARTYANVRMRYELRLASTEPGRGRLVRQLLRTIPALRGDRESFTLVLRVALAVLLGPERAHAVVEHRKA